MASEFYQRLKAARSHANFSQAALADLCGVSRGTVSLWESQQSNTRTEPGMSRLKLIAAITGVPIWWLVDDTVDLNTIWHGVAVNDGHTENGLPTWSMTSSQHLRLANAMKKAIDTEVFTPTTAGAIADLIEAITKTK